MRAWLAVLAAGWPATDAGSVVVVVDGVVATISAEEVLAGFAGSIRLCGVYTCCGVLHKRGTSRWDCSEKGVCHHLSWLSFE